MNNIISLVELFEEDSDSVEQIVIQREQSFIAAQVACGVADEYVNLLRSTLMKV